MFVLTGAEACGAAGWAKSITSRVSNDAGRNQHPETAVFEAVTQVLHPWQRDDGTGRMLWKEVAEALGRDWTDDAIRTLPVRADIWRRFGVGLSEGDFGDGPTGDDVRAHLTRALAQVTAPNVTVSLYHETAAAMHGKPPTLFLTDLSGLAQIRHDFVYSGSDRPIPGPEWWWPADQSWLVHTDYDAVVTDVYGPAQLGDLIVADHVLEALPLAIQRPSS